ncbi:hypothetical protein T11_10898, partial [Trichinella zimbabwensis]
LLYFTHSYHFQNIILYSYNYYTVCFGGLLCYYCKPRNSTPVPDYIHDFTLY